MFSELYNGHFDWALVSAAVAGIVIVFCIWWLYFIEPDHLHSTQAHRVFLWGYGHIAIFLAGTLIAAGLGAQPWTIAIILIITLGLRIKLQETR